MHAMLNETPDFSFFIFIYCVPLSGLNRNFVKSRLLGAKKRQCAVPFSDEDELKATFGPNGEWKYSKEAGAPFFGKDERSYVSGRWGGGG